MTITLLLYNVKLSLFIPDHYWFMVYTAHSFQLYRLFYKLQRCIGQTPSSVEHYLVAQQIDNKSN